LTLAHITKKSDTSCLDSTVQITSLSNFVNWKFSNGCSIFCFFS